MADDARVQALISAMVTVHSDSEPERGKRIRKIIESAAATVPGLAEAWVVARAQGGPDEVRRCAELLLRGAGERADLRATLETWYREYGGGESSGPLQAQEAPAQSNVVDGYARLTGSVIQAGHVHGGVHLHHHEARHHPVPRQLPSVSAHFVGRARDLAQLNAYRDSHPRFTPQLVVLSGQAGVGKTTLASHWLRGIADQFPDGQLYVDLGGYGAGSPAQLSHVVEQFLRSLGATAVPARTDEKVALWRSLTADITVAVLLDNAFTAAQVRPLVPSNPDSLVVVTSRRHLAALTMEGAVLHQVGVLDSAESVQLLSRGGGGSRVAGELEAAREVVSLCAFLPLAVSLAAAQLAARPQRSVAALAASLSRGQGPLDTLRMEGEAAVRVALDQSYGALPAEVVRAYDCMGVLPVARFSTEMVAACCAVSRDEAEQMLNTMVEASLLEEDASTGQYRFHDLVRLHAKQRAEAGDAARNGTTMRRFVDWCLFTATQAEELLSPSHRSLARDYTYPPTTPVPFQEEEGALTWLDTHRTTLMAAVRHSESVHWDDACWQLVDAMWPLFLRLRPADMWVEAHTMGLAAAQRAGDRQAQGRMLTSGGNGWRNAHRPDEAISWYRRALAHAREDGDVRQEAQAQIGLGNAYLLLGHLDRAGESLHAALAIRESIGYRRGAALARISLGELDLARDRPAAASRHLRRAHRDLTAAGDTYDAARALALLGRARAADGETDAGVDLLRQAHRNFQEAGSPHWQARTLEMIGQVMQRQNDPDAARRWYEEARVLYSRLSPRDAERLEGRLEDL
ncbi:tetratricopeptide repeat protein [Streptomyces sp. NPDC059853]|uniref:tetratricopeptide repeat protein n=1 Tax=Streptomyces sp. NPDC059853 TaxID=3346973 RepID=UPI00364C272D